MSSFVNNGLFLQVYTKEAQNKFQTKGKTFPQKEKGKSAKEAAIPQRMARWWERREQESLERRRRKRRRRGMSEQKMPGNKGQEMEKSEG